MTSQAVARPVRTATQFVPAAVVVEFIDAFLADLDGRQYAALLALLTVIVGFIQVTIEDRTGKAFLRKVPGPAVDVVETGPPSVPPGDAR